MYIEKNLKPKFKSFKLQIFTNQKINFKVCLLPLCDISKLIFPIPFEKDI
jgi:hypothetical protein